MSNKIVGACAIKPGAPKVRGKQGKLELVPVDTPSRINRDTKGKQLEKQMKDEQTDDWVWDWSIHVPPLVHRIRAAGGRLERMNGDHTTHMFRLTFPQATHMWAYVTEIDDVDTYHRNFDNCNGGKTKALTPDERYVHKFQIDAQVQAQVARMQQCGAYVYGCSEPGGIVGDLHGSRVSAQTFTVVENLIGSDATGLQAIKESIQTVRGTWPSLNKLNKPMLGGFAMIYEANPALFAATTKVGKDWAIFTERLQEITSQEFQTQVKGESPPEQNRTIESFANGIIALWFKKDYSRPGGCVKHYKKEKIKTPWA